MSHQGSELSPLLFAIAVDVITENARTNVVDKLLYADDLVLISETMKPQTKDFEIERVQRKLRV